MCILYVNFIFIFILIDGYVYVILYNYSFKCVILYVDLLGSCFCFRFGRVVWIKLFLLIFWRWRCRLFLVFFRCCWAFCWVLWIMRKLIFKLDIIIIYDNVLCYYRNWIWKIIKIFNWYFRMIFFFKVVFENNLM